MTDSPRPRAAAPAGGLTAFLVPTLRTPEKARFPGFLRFALLVVELALILLVIDQFQIENRAFGRLMTLACGGFLVHTWLPVRLRLPFFTLLSMAGIAAVLGREASVQLIGLGLGLSAIAMLPVRVLYRSLIMLVICGLLIALRVDYLHAPWSSAIWPVLGSMFMFRMIIFLYDQSHGEKPGSVWETISYFFLLPNVCFTLFPVVDFKSFRRTYYSEGSWQCYQTGIRWMVRGLVHLLLYRFLYYYAVMAPTEVSTFPELVQYLVANIALYLRVSGVFHLCIGILRLYGFALPETHFLYYLSASVNDFWRRANIYWKDFMLKVFYLPVFFKLRRKGNSVALIVSTAVVVVVTWALHSYQVFWLSKSFPIRWQDGVFWTALGTLMVINTLSENRSSKARGRHARGKREFDLVGRLVTAGKILATFSFMCALWSIWNCNSFGEWLEMWRMTGTGRSTESVAAARTAALVFLPMITVVMLIEGAGGSDSDPDKLPLRSFGATSLGLVLLLGFGTPELYNRLDADGSRVVQSFRSARLNRLDAERMQGGYYEDLMDVEKFNVELGVIRNSAPRGWQQLHETRAMQPSADFLLTELVPNTDMTYKDAHMVVNEWGLRDRPYTLEKPEGTHRTAILGASYIMGSGVDNEQTFENLVEDRMNAEWAKDGRSFEILNFAVGGYSPLQRLFAFESRGLKFDLDMALYVAHENEVFRLYRHISAARDRGETAPWPELVEILDRAGVTPDMAGDAQDAALEPYIHEILEFSFRKTVEVCRANGITPVFCLLPTLELYGQANDIEWMFDMAREAGFETISLFGVYDGSDLFDIRVADWDYHPNVKGHGLIAARLFAELAQHPEWFMPR